MVTDEHECGACRKQGEPATRVPACHSEPMESAVLNDDEAVTEWAAKYVVKRINDFKPNKDKYFVLGLPTGGTPTKMYKKLVEFYK